MNKVTESTRKIIGRRINELLAINDVKQKELAAHLSVSDNIVSYFVKGARVPNTEQIIKIAKFFNVPTDYLLGLTDIGNVDISLKAVNVIKNRIAESVRIDNITVYRVNNNLIRIDIKENNK